MKKILLTVIVILGLGCSNQDPNKVVKDNSGRILYQIGSSDYEMRTITCMGCDYIVLSNERTLDVCLLHSPQCKNPIHTH